MMTSTIMDQVVTPALFFKFGRKVYERSPSTAYTDHLTAAPIEISDTVAIPQFEASAVSPSAATGGTSSPSKVPRHE